MIKEFKEGRSYKCLRRKRPMGWNDGGKMDFMLTGKVYKCTFGNGSCATFGSESSESWGWDLRDFVEVGYKSKAPTHLVVWEEDEDPCKFFNSEQEANEFIKKLSENSDVKQDSIILVEVKSAKKITIQKSLRKANYTI